MCSVLPMDFEMPGVAQNFFLFFFGEVLKVLPKNALANLRTDFFSVLNTFWC